MTSITSETGAFDRLRSDFRPSVWENLTRNGTILHSYCQLRSILKLIHMTSVDVAWWIWKVSPNLSMKGFEAGGS